MEKVSSKHDIELELYVQKNVMLLWSNIGINKMVVSKMEGTL